MSYGIVAVIAVTSLINLAFTYGVVRRLKEHEERLAALAPVGPLRSANPPVGSSVPDFSVTTWEGRSLDGAMLRSGAAYVGFFDTGCAPCREELPAFARLSRESVTGRFVAFIAGDEELATRLSALFDDHAFVVLEDQSSSTAASFGVDAFPTLLALNDGIVTGNALSSSDLPRPSRAEHVEPA